MKWLVSWLMSLLAVINPVSSPAPSPELATVGPWRYETMAIGDISRLQLDSNFPVRADALVLKQDKGCQFLVSAGFYDTGFNHLGWFQVGGREISPAQANNFLNGFLAIGPEGAAIGFQPDKAAVFGVQSGPLLVYDGQPLKLTIKDDQPRRRVAAVVTEEGQLVFLVLLSQESDYAGPLLTETPALVKKILPKAVAGLNLDGGSASAFLSEAVFLPEYSPIGGYFCYTEL